jgi:hypothetical protein
MKYLIMEDFSGQPVPFIFPRRVDHADMRDQLPYKNIISCGYMELADGKIKCFGGNPELQAQAQPEDITVLTEALRERN